MNSAMELAGTIQDLEEEGQKIFDRMEAMKAELVEEAEEIDEMRMVTRPFDCAHRLIYRKECQTTQPCYLFRK